MRSTLRYGSHTFILIIAAVIFIASSVSYAVISDPNLPKYQSKEGILDLTQTNVSEHPLKLKGQWGFYWKELLSPEDIKHRSTMDDDKEDWINIPRSWLGYHLDGQQLDGTGFATFRLTILINEHDENERLALKIPTIFHAYKLWVNGELMTEVGVVGQNKSEMIPELATNMVFFQPVSDRVELVMQVANFHHYRGGITKDIELGGIEVLQAKSDLRIASEMFITSSLIMIGIYHLFLFMLRRQDRAPLYFGLFIFLFGIRTLLVGELMVTKIWPSIPWELQFKIEYLILCSGVYTILLYFNSMYPHYVSRWVYRTTQLVTFIFFIIILATPALIYTKFLLLIGIVVVLHTIYLIVGLIKSAIKRMEGALIFLVVSLVLLVTVSNDFLYYSELSPVANTSPIGLLVFTIAQMILLFLRFVRATANEERITIELQDTNNKLIEMNLNLERTVQERTHALSEAHDDLRRSYNRLLLSEEGRKKLLAYITHDLRSPLSSMLGYVEAVQDGVKPERNEQYLRYIRDNTIRINRMIEDLSFLSHLETGQVSYRMEQVHIIRFLQEFFEQYELVVRDAGLNFVLDMEGAEDQPFALSLIEMDVQRLEQVLFNLVSNAMKYTPRGGVVRIALTVDEVDDSRYAVISIQDSGAGIPPVQLEQIFGRNYKYARPGIDKGIEGSGLGLAICREIVQGHGGIVRAESDGKTGSIFYVSLPFIKYEGR